MLDFSGGYPTRSISCADYACGCAVLQQRPEKKRDCFFYDEDHDMGATIPCCSYHDGYGNCPCEKCDKYLRKNVGIALVKELLDKGEIDQNGGS